MNVIAVFKASYRPMINSFTGEHSEALSPISEVYQVEEDHI